MKVYIQSKFLSWISRDIKFCSTESKPDRTAKTNFQLSITMLDLVSSDTLWQKFQLTAKLISIVPESRLLE